MNDAARLVLFTKPTIPGRVKTRLIGGDLPGPHGGRIEADTAAALHRAFLEDLVEELTQGNFELYIAWALDDAVGQRFKRAEALTSALSSKAAGGFEQRGETLGQRLYEGLTRVTEGGPYVGAVGSDHPDLSARILEEGFRRLRGADVVLGPADDGGYYFLGVRSDRLVRHLFSDIAWSTDRVLSDTLARCGDLGLRVELLPEGHDVDTPADLTRLVARLQGRDHCPRTRELLQQLGALGVSTNESTVGRMGSSRP
ncbi:MAG: TIGR04282 family arsenosugar biosynthesis glycosyltransferase [Thermoanaerobaculia bacterium]|nr:TIGR04282 family arsenosugar biosynthesis glycosyltransferase [Thermoanaerobaculia bacterium]